MTDDKDAVSNQPREMAMSEDHDEMGITPRLTVDVYKKVLDLVALGDGREQHPALPELTTNAKQGMLDKTKLCPECQASPYLDTDAYNKNTRLAEAISAALNQIRPPDKDGAHFVLAWRLYPIKDHPRFNILDGCSCGCGDDTLSNHHRRHHGGGGGGGGP
jgi:hypothetical protein